MLPANNYYRVTGFTAAGQPAWGPNNQQVIGSGGTFDIGTWVPNNVISWNPPLQSLDLETNAALNPNQGRLNFQDNGTVSWAVDASGNLQATAAVADPPLFQTNSVDNAVQDKLNLKNGSGITVVADGAGGATINNTQVQSNPRANWHAIQSVVALNFPSATGAYGCQGSGSGLGIGQPATATEPGYSPATTSISPGDSARWQHISTPTSSDITFGAVRNMEWKCKYPLLANVQAWACIQKAAVLTSTSTTPADTYGFRFSPASGDVNWKCYVDTAGSRTIVDSGVPVTAAFVKLTMVSDGASSFTFFINGVQVAMITTNLPVASDYLYSTIKVDNASTANIREVQICYAYYDTI
jgi:plastocyanin